jgi:hypothetical protein
MRLRFSIKSFLIAFTIVSVACAAFLYPSPMLASGVYTAALLIFLCGFPAAVLSRNSDRAYWIGFTICGAGYLAMATLDERGDPSQAAHVHPEPSLLTSQLLLRVHYYWPTSRIGSASGTSAPTTSEGVMRIGDQLFFIRDDAQSFIRVGNSVFSLLLAFVGGALGQRCHGNKEQNIIDPNDDP